MREHYHNLQALRGVACLMVVLVHLCCFEAKFGVQTPLFREIQWFGFAGVDLFFVLSGFLITSTNRKHLGQPADVPGYLFRRFWRIYPMFWVALAANVGLCAAIGSEIIAPEMNSWWVWWATLVPVSSPNIFVSQAWTLTYELMFYLAFATIMFLPPRLGAAMLCAWGAIIFAGLTGPHPAGLIAIHVLSPFVLEFLAGCTIAWLAAHSERRGGRAAVGLGLVYAIAAMLLVHAVSTETYVNATSRQRTRVLMFGPPAALFVYGFVALEGRWPRRVPHWLLRIGDASYSLYLLHPAVLSLGMYLGYFVPHSRIPHLLWLTGTFVACLAVGLLAYRFIERPLLNMAKRKRTKPAPTANTYEPPAKVAA